MIHEFLHKFVLEQLMVTGHQQNMAPRIMMNVGNPETAFSFGQLPNEGIGLARLEFVSWTQHLAVAGYTYHFTTCSMDNLWIMYG